MRMVLAITQEPDVRALLDKLTANGLRATKISSSRGFLEATTCSLLICVEDDQVGRAVDIICSACCTHHAPVNPLSFAASSPDAPVTLPVTDEEVGGADIFVWKVESGNV
jgi:uncharacterized protein YaaQ